MGENQTSQERGRGRGRGEQRGLYLSGIATTCMGAAGSAVQRSPLQEIIKRKLYHDSVNEDGVTFESDIIYNEIFPITGYLLDGIVPSFEVEITDENKKTIEELLKKAESEEVTLEKVKDINRALAMMNLFWAGKRIITADDFRAIIKAATDKDEVFVVEAVDDDKPAPAPKLAARVPLPPKAAGELPPQIDVTVSDAYKRLWALEVPARIDLSVVALDIRKKPFTVEGIVSFMKDNDLDTKDFKDIVFSIITVKLITLEAITPNKEDETNHAITDDLKGAVTQKKLDHFAPLAKSMLVVALHAFAQGSYTDVISWYDSFAAVKGSFISANRFTLLARLIICSGAMTEIVKLITVGDVRRENTVLRYRLTRLSTPDLIRRAVVEFKTPLILKYFDPNAIKEYRRFSEAGVLAQIAAGPLAPYLKGNVNVLDHPDIPDNYRLVDLKAIENAPYDERLIRKAYIILETIGFDFGKWYQGKKAMRKMDATDVTFRAVVKTVFDRMKERTAGTPLSTEEMDKAEKEVEAEELVAAVKEISAWKTTKV